jgi:hypothetical protein
MTKIVIRDARLSFPDLFEPVQYKNQGPFNYRATFLIPKASPMKKAVDAAIRQVASEKWGPKAEATLKTAIAGGKTCFTDGDAKEYNGYADNWALVAIRSQDDGRPVVVDRSKHPIVASDGKIYSGCYVNGTVEIWAQDNSFGRAIRATLVNVQFVKDGESFGGASPADDSDLDDLGYEEDLDDDDLA